MLGFEAITRKVFGTPNDRKVKAVRPLVDKINALEPEYQALSDDELKARTAAFRERHAGGESLDSLLPEAFANCREAAWRALGLRAFDVQLIGGIFLHRGNIAEMKTGEGKTLVATLPAYLNALSGEPVHIVTVNDYLAKRDAEWMGKVYGALGMTTGVVYPQQPEAEKHDAYGADVTYATNNELGFDYLRDNMKSELDQMVQRGQSFAIVDEVDSILIDEARTPLIISGPSQDRSDLYTQIDTLVPRITEEHFTLDEKTRNVSYTDEGNEFIEELLLAEGILPEDQSLYDPESTTLVHHVTQALRAHKLYQRDTNYIVRDNQVILIDEFTGRMMPGRRLSDGLHQAIEAKEGVAIQPENVTLASVTFQNYFRLYDTLSGMTGTATTEAEEFRQIYGLGVVAIPTNEPIARTDEHDQVYRTADEKFNAIIEEIRGAHERGQPILVGTTSIEKSEHLSTMLEKHGIPHNVLNARQHEQEAYIIAEAGKPGAVTIATNMAGRGTDIQLGGNVEMKVMQAMAADPDADPAELRRRIEAEVGEDKAKVIEAGGLYVLATERHESRRIDNQLRGRAGRQGDPGSTRFFLSLEDSLMRLFGSDRVQRMMKALGLERGEAIEHKMVSNAVERAQKKVESRNFDMRKQLLEYDDVANDQRRVIYEQRNEILAAEQVAEAVAGIREEVLDLAISDYVPPQSLAEQWDLPGLQDHLKSEFNLEAPVVQWAEEDERFHEEQLRERLQAMHRESYEAKVAEAGEALMRRFEKQVMLQVLDTRWKEHLQSMDHLRRGIHLRGYAQKNPKQEYKRESFELFQSLLANIKADVTRILSHVQVRRPEEVEELEQKRREALQRETATASSRHEDPDAVERAESPAAPLPGADGRPVRREGPKVGRNDACPCGSGKKYKQCCGKLN